MQPVARRLLQFDTHRLIMEYQKLESYSWMLHPSSQLHDNGWFALPLFAVNGDVKNMVAKIGDFQPTPTFLETQAFKQVIDFFQCPLKRVRLLRLKAKGVIQEHTDEPFYDNEETVNLHILIQTNPDVQFVVGGRSLRMQLGECWCIDTLQPHSVSNRGWTDRIHLVMHCVINPFITDLLDNAPLILYSHGVKS